MRVHPVGEGLDHHRAVAGSAFLQRPPGDGQAGQHVVAVDPHPGKAVAGRPFPQRHPRLPGHRFGDRPLVVLAVEDDRRVEGRREDHALVHVALAGGAVAEERDGRLVGVRSGPVRDRQPRQPMTPRWRPDDAVEPLTHRVAGRVEHLVADDDRVAVEPGRLGVPAALVGARGRCPAGQRRVDPPAPGDAVLPVGREGHVVRVASPGRRRSGPPPGRAAAPRCSADPAAAGRCPPGRTGGPAPCPGTGRAAVRPVTSIGKSSRGVNMPSGDSSWIRSSPWLVARSPAITSDGVGAPRRPAAPRAAAWTTRPVCPDRSSARPGGRPRPVPLPCTTPHSFGPSPGSPGIGTGATRRRCVRTGPVGVDGGCERCGRVDRTRSRPLDTFDSGTAPLGYSTWATSDIRTCDGRDLRYCPRPGPTAGLDRLGDDPMDRTFNRIPDRCGITSTDDTETAGPERGFSARAVRGSAPRGPRTTQASGIAAT